MRLQMALYEELNQLSVEERESCDIEIIESLENPGSKV